uniref:Zgc:194209 n=1 Tax=Nothobranchius furzeri TaxID=105023 RepID=A0A8C6KZ70_NOTFU
MAVALAVYWLPSPINPKPHNLKGPPPALVGLLAVNTQLQRGRRLFAGKLHGPESFTADDNGNVYTGTVDGKLWRIGPDDSLTLVTHMGQNLPECGSYSSVFLFKTIKFSFLKNGSSVFSGSSTDYELVCGRPHGVRLDRHGQLIVADSYFGLYPGFLFQPPKTLPVCFRYWLKGPKAGTKEVILDNMIGYPDNIRLSDHGTFLVGITTPRFQKLLPPFLDMLAPYPKVKSFLVKVMPLSWFNLLLPYYGLVLELGPNGEIVRTLHDPEGRLTWAVSDVFQHRGRTYLGSTDLPFLPVLEGW